MDKTFEKCVFYMQDRNDCINPRDGSGMKKCKEDVRIVEKTFDDSFIKKI